MLLMNVGEEDQDSYDINRLKKPVEDRPTPKLNHSSPPEKVIPPEAKVPVQRRGERSVNEIYS